jgi:glycosidase
MYEVNPLVFSSTRDLQGVIGSLDEIKALGVNVVWLMPIYEMGEDRSVGSPYCISDYLQVNPSYGTLEDLRELVDSAHEKGMAVMLDWVANHTAWDHVWMSDRDYYVQENGVIIHPPGTNWQDVAELNYANAEMRAEMISAMKYWVLEANVDGFRCDYATGVPGWFWQEAIDSLRSIPNRDLIMFAESGDLTLLSKGFDMAFSWNYYGTLLNVFNNNGNARDLYTTHRSEFSSLAAGKTTVRFVTNHDQHAWDGTPQQLFGSQEAVMAAAASAFYMGGIPLMYNGQEIAVPYQLPFFVPTSVAINWSLNPTVRTQYEELLAAYHDYEFLRSSEIEKDYSTFALSAVEKIANGDTALVIINTRNELKALNLPANWQNRNVTDIFTQASVGLGSQLNLDPYEVRVLKR